MCINVDELDTYYTRPEPDEPRAVAPENSPPGSLIQHRPGMKPSLHNSATFTRRLASVISHPLPRGIRACPLQKGARFPRRVPSTRASRAASSIRKQFRLLASRARHRETAPQTED